MDTIIPLKRCYMCNNPKPLDEFYIARSRSDKRTAECKDCSKKISKQRTRTRVDDITKGMRAVGFTRADYKKAWEQQDGKCAICGNRETGKHQSGTTKRLAVDHDHKTGKFRGLLCNSCNVKLAILEEAVFVSAAQEYLSQHDKLPHEFFEGGRLF